MRKTKAERTERRPADNNPLYQAALAVENDEMIIAEMAEWEEATLGDGLTR